MNLTTAAPKLSTLILLSALAVLPVNIFLPSLGNMADDFGVDYGVMGLALTAYAGVSACLQILLGPISDRFGRRPVILFGLGMFIFATLGCIMAPDAWSLLAFRMLQAIIAPTYAVALAVIRDTTSAEQTASRIGYVSMAWAVSPMLGPTLGGLLDEAFGWRATFWFLTVFGVAIFALCWFGLGETNRTPSRSVREQYRAYPSLLGSGRFWAYAICMAFSLGAFYAFLVGAPLAAGSAFGLSPAIVGIYMGSITGGFMLGSFLAARFSARLGLGVTLISGRLIACVGMLLGLLLYWVGVESELALFGPCMFVGLANGLSMPSANAGALSVRPGLVGSAAGLAGAIAVGGGAFMSWLSSSLLTEGNARYMLLVVMLGSTLIALAAALCALHLERRPAKGVAVK